MSVHSTFECCQLLIGHLPARHVTTAMCRLCSVMKEGLETSGASMVITALMALRPMASSFSPTSPLRSHGASTEQATLFRGSSITCAAADIVEAARLFATAGSGAAASGTGLHMARHQNLTTQLVQTLEQRKQSST